ncbi:syntaphilin-like isoform X1 [Mobula hypostoma]|uniref:syntaphilin-like isoform X1 n=1 Tax=Mobula hypostoma TaxID=723540 RepID=UPI002FC27A42
MSGSGSRRPSAPRSRGLHGRRGFSSLFKAALAPASAPHETQPLLRPSRRSSPRDTCTASSLSSSSNSSSYKGSDSSPTPRRSSKYSSCSENHGIKPPSPEQYLTPLQQKEVCIRHLKAKLKETEERLDERDVEVEDLKMQLSRMQEDWIEEECHRVEAQLSLKEARKEIKQLKQVIETVKNNLVEKDKGIQKYFIDINIQNKKLETLLQSMELAQDGASHSTSGSPAKSLTRSSTYTKLSERVGELQGIEGFPAPHHSSLASGMDRTLEGLSFSVRPGVLMGQEPEEAACRPGPQQVILRDQSVQTDHAARQPDLEVIAEKVLKSSACSPRSLTSEGEASEILPDQQTLDTRLVDRQSATGGLMEISGQAVPVEPDGWLTHWSHHYIVDLLAVTIPAVPTLAWIFSTQQGSSQPLYNIGMLLRCCCVIALHSLRRLNNSPPSSHCPRFPS